MGGNLKSRHRFLFINKNAVAFVALTTVMLTAFQNCGELRSISAVGNSSAYAPTSLEDADVVFSKGELVLTESTLAGASDAVTVRLKSGATSATINYQLMQTDNNGEATGTTVLGTLEGSATISEAFTSTDIRILAGSNALLKEAKNKVLFLVVKKDKPTVNTFIIPVRVVLIADPIVPPTPVDPTVPKVITPDNATVAERQAECVKYATARPSFVTNFNDSVMNLGSGLSNANSNGAAIEGNSNGGSLTIDINKNITDQAKFDLWKCDQTTVVLYRLVTEVVTGVGDDNPKPAPVFTTAMQADGSQRDISTAALRNTLGSDIYSIANNGGNNNPARADYTAATNSRSISFFTRYTGGNNATQKCVGGTVWLRVTAQMSYPNSNGAQFTTKFSDPQYVRLNITNNCWKEYRMRNADNSNYDAQIALGTDVAVSGDWAAALAETDYIDVARQNVGAIYMFKKENGSWVRKGPKLVVNELLSNEQITNIDLRGDVLVAGVPKHGRGSAYVFRRSGDTWTLTNTIPSAFPTGAPQFGRGIAIGATHIAVGAPYARAVYLYPYTSTTVGLPITINSPVDQGVSQSHFGASIVFNGSYLFIGAPLEPGIETDEIGHVNIYNMSSGSPVLYRIFEGNQAMDRFGSNIAVNGTKLGITSEVFKNDAGVSVGRVDYYADFTAPLVNGKVPSTRNWVGGVSNSYIGNGLVITANGIFLSTPNSTLISPPGLVEYYPFTNGAGTTFGNLFRIRAYNEEQAAKFGWSMAADGNNIMIGAKNKRDGAADSGAAFIYEAR